MGGTVSVRTNTALGDASPRLWVAAGLLFGLGDMVTTSIGLGLPGVVETNPIAAFFFQHSVLGALVGLKLVAFGSCYALWRLVPKPHSLGIPLGLTLVGGVITGWNLHVLLVALAV